MIVRGIVSHADVFLTCSGDLLGRAKPRTGCTIRRFRSAAYPLRPPIPSIAHDVNLGATSAASSSTWWSASTTAGTAATSFARTRPLACFYVLTSLLIQFFSENARAKSMRYQSCLFFSLCGSATAATSCSATQKACGQRVRSRLRHSGCDA